MINYHNIVFPFLHRHGCRQEADSNFRDFARTSQIKSSIRQSRSLRINNKSWKTNSFQVNCHECPYCRLSSRGCVKTLAQPHILT